MAKKKKAKHVHKGYDLGWASKWIERERSRGTSHGKIKRTLMEGTSWTENEIHKHFPHLKSDKIHGHKILLISVGVMVILSLGLLILNQNGEKLAGKAYYGDDVDNEDMDEYDDLGEDEFLEEVDDSGMVEEDKEIDPLANLDQTIQSKIIDAGLDLNGLIDNFKTEGSLTEEQYNKLAEVGFEKKLVNNYLNQIK